MRPEIFRHFSYAALWDFLKFLWRQYNEKGCRQQAAALTYMTLFALVPLMTVVFTMFSLFPAFEGMFDVVQNFLFEHMLPDSGIEIQQYLQDFTQQARSLTLAGLLILVVTAFLMIKNIEMTFNTIWGVESARKGLSSFLLYWAILSLGPLLLGVGLAMSTYVLSLRLFVDEYDALGLVPALFSFFPWVLTTIAFTLLFVAVPNCKVPFRHALFGGVLTAVCFELCKDLFGWIVAHSSFKAVYGAFAIVPLFLMWIYVLWMIVLIGALFVRTLSAYYEVNRRSRYPDLTAGLIVMWLFYRKQESGESLDVEDLLQHGIEAEQWHRIREALLHARIVAMTAEQDFVLSRDLHKFSLQQLAGVVGVKPLLSGVDDHLRRMPWFQEASQHLGAVDDYRDKQLGLPLAKLFENGVTAESDDAS